MNHTETTYLFVYSSLRRGFQQITYHYLTQFFRFVSDGKVKGILSDMGDKPVATPVLSDLFIIGELYQLNVKNGSYVFGQLDSYEGVTTDEGEPGQYRRAITTVYTGDGTEIEAWVYWYNGDVSEKPIIASGDVLQYAKSKIS